MSSQQIQISAQIDPSNVFTGGINSRGDAKGDFINRLALEDRRRQKAELEDAKRRLASGQLAFSSVELEDIKRLDVRRAKSKGTRKFKLKRSGTDTVLLKKVEAEKATKIFDSSSIQNKNFDLGLPNTATQADRDFAIKQQQRHIQERKEIQANLERNKIEKQKEIAQGKELQKTFGSTSEEQKKKLLALGINLSGKLSARALARLRKRGLI